MVVPAIPVAMALHGTYMIQDKPQMLPPRRNCWRQVLSPQVRHNADHIFYYIYQPVPITDTDAATQREASLTQKPLFVGEVYTSGSEYDRLEDVS